MTEIRQFATWDDGKLQIRKWVLFEEFERLDADAACERAERQSWQRLAEARAAMIRKLVEEIGCLRLEIADLRRVIADQTLT